MPTSLPNQQGHQHQQWLQHHGRRQQLAPTQRRAPPLRPAQSDRRTERVPATPPSRRLPGRGVPGSRWLLDATSGRRLRDGPGCPGCPGWWAAGCLPCRPAALAARLLADCVVAGAQPGCEDRDAGWRPFWRAAGKLIAAPQAQRPSRAAAGSACTPAAPTHGRGTLPSSLPGSRQHAWR